MPVRFKTRARVCPTGAKMNVQRQLGPDAQKLGPMKGPKCCKQERSERLSGGLLCDRSAELERPVFFAAARYQSDNGAKERHGCDFLGHGDPHHCHCANSITSPRGRPQHMIDAKGYFVCAPVRRGHGALGGSSRGHHGQAVVRPTPPDLIDRDARRAAWRIRSDRVSVCAEGLREDTA
jgi:hypothetical protein